MKFTSALSAIVLVVFAQTVSASPAIVSRAVEKLPNEYVQIISTELSNGTVVSQTVAFAKIVDIVVNKTAPNPHLKPDTENTVILIESKDYAAGFELTSTVSRI
jgi:hypothetical protein